MIFYFRLVLSLEDETSDPYETFREAELPSNLSELLNSVQDVQEEL